jgi:hypothetical protein
MPAAHLLWVATIFCPWRLGIGTLRCPRRFGVRAIRYRSSETGGRRDVVGRLGLFRGRCAIGGRGRFSLRADVLSRCWCFRRGWRMGCLWCGDGFRSGRFRCGRSVWHFNVVAYIRCLYVGALSRGRLGFGGLRYWRSGGLRRILRFSGGRASPGACSARAPHRLLARLGAEDMTASRAFERRSFIRQNPFVDSVTGLTTCTLNFDHRSAPLFRQIKANTSSAFRHPKEVMPRLLARAMFTRLMRFSRVRRDARCAWR